MAQLSVLRLSSTSRRERALKAAGYPASHGCYTDESVSVYAQTDGEPHNTTCCSQAKWYLRGLSCTALQHYQRKHPLGIFHPHTLSIITSKKKISASSRSWALPLLPPRLIARAQQVQSVMEQCLAKNDRKANAVYGQLTTNSTTISSRLGAPDLR